MVTGRLIRRPRLNMQRLVRALSAGLATPLEAVAFGAVVFGVYQIYHPAAWIVGGALGVLYAQQLEHGEEQE